MEKTHDDDYGDMLIKTITDIIEKNIREYNIKLAEKYNMDISELDQLWEEVSGDSKPKKTRAKKEDKKEEKGAKKEKKDDSKEKKKTVEGGCPYTFTKGKNEGTTCGSKPKDGGDYCSKHQKFEGVGQTEKKKIPTPEKSSTETPEKKRIVIRLNKDIDKYWNPETKMVFKSKEEKVVVGKYDDDEIQKLTDGDIETCKKYCFKYEIMEEGIEDEGIEDEMPELEEE